MNMLRFITALILTISITACSNDDQAKDQTNDYANLILGRWSSVDMVTKSINKMGVIKVKQLTHTRGEYLDIKQNGEYFWYYCSSECYNYLPKPVMETGKYVLSGNNLSLIGFSDLEFITPFQIETLTSDELSLHVKYTFEPDDTDTDYLSYEIWWNFKK